MSDITKFVSRQTHELQRTLNKQSPAILAGIGVSGTLATAYLAGRASWKAALIIRESEEAGGVHDDRTERLKERLRLVWMLYLPAGLSAGLTVAAIITGTTVSHRRVAAITAAYSLTDKAFTDYREAVADRFGEIKEKNLRDSIAQSQVTESPPQKTELALLTVGQTLCLEGWSGRYFMSDMETLRRAEALINLDLDTDGYATLDRFHELVGLSGVGKIAQEMGWRQGKDVELKFSAAISPGSNEPVMVVNFNYLEPI